MEPRISLLAFAAVWLATWAACWFGLARAWPMRHRVLGAAVLSSTLKPNGEWEVVTTDGRTLTITEEALRDSAFPLVTRRKYGGAKTWAPLIATLVAFAADLVVGRIS